MRKKECGNGDSGNAYQRYFERPIKIASFIHSVILYVTFTDIPEYVMKARSSAD